MASPLDLLTRVVAGHAEGTDAIVVFGSVARGEAHADIDLAVIAPADWGRRADVRQQVQERLGNSCDVLHLTAEQSTAHPATEPVIDEIRRDGIVLVGQLPRRSRPSEPAGPT